MKIIKRNGSEAVFDISKIITAIGRANKTVPESERMTQEQIVSIASAIEAECVHMNRAPSVEEIQEMVETAIMGTGAFEVAKQYIRYRYTRSLVRRSNTTDNRILSLIECNNEEVKQENANKNPTVNSAFSAIIWRVRSARTLPAACCCRRISWRRTNEGIIHFHDTDYYAQHMHNCDLVNLEDMLQNGTVITGTMIEKPHSFSTACNIATQIIAQVASNQYGGQSISPCASGAVRSGFAVKRFAETCWRRPRDAGRSARTERRSRTSSKNGCATKFSKGVQTIQYQVVTLMTTNGQAPFVTVFMYLNEAKNAQEKRDLAMIIEEVLQQRYEGVKNEEGVWVTPAFPKLIYVLEEDNIHEDSEYWYLTKLAAKCTAKRLVPDYISEKKMKEAQGGQLLPRDGLPQLRLRRGRMKTAITNSTAGSTRAWLRSTCRMWRCPPAAIWTSSGRSSTSGSQLCYRALMCRHNRLKGTLSDAAPILWQDGAIARLKKGENDRQAALRRVFHDFAGLCGSVRMRHAT